MNSKILINAVDHEECRIAKVTDSKLEEFHIESASREITQGNIYKGIITRLEPSLQAVFVDYGAERQISYFKECCLPAFAKKADEEGYKGVASLFRAAAHAENVHAENHAEVIRQLGGEAKADIEPIKVGTTKENLQVAIEGESYEWDVMYPSMLNRARRDRDRQAMRSLNFAMTAERDHGRFYRTALADLENWKTPRDFYVCSVCGETVDKLDFRKCPSCFAPVDEYKKVN